MARCMLSFDVEDWFQVDRFQTRILKGSWDRQELRVERNVRRILELLVDRGARATFFVLGWVASRCGALVKEIASEGHEIASHGYDHDRVRGSSPAAFRKDVQQAKAALEDMTGEPVMGYRAPTFSITSWAIPLLRQAGYLYDSSYFPGAYRYPDRLGQMEQGGPLVRHLLDGFYEVEVPSVRVAGRMIPWGGGGFFRLCPYRLYRLGVRRILNERGSFLFYLHPWEMDASQPRVKDLGKRDSFRQYYGLARTEAKLTRLLTEFEFMPVRDALPVRQ